MMTFLTDLTVLPGSFSYSHNFATIPYIDACSMQTLLVPLNLLVQKPLFALVATHMLSSLRQP